MRITRQELHNLINEEVSKMLLQAGNRRLVEALDDQDDQSQLPLDVVDVSDLLNFAKAYAKLGRAVQEQLEELLDQQEYAQVNPNAVDLIEEFLGGYSSDIDEAIAAWKAADEA